MAHMNGEESMVMLPLKTKWRGPETMNFATYALTQNHTYGFFAGKLDERRLALPHKTQAGLQSLDSLYDAEDVERFSSDPPRRTYYCDLCKTFSPYGPSTQWIRSCSKCIGENISIDHASCGSQDEVHG